MTSLPSGKFQPAKRPPIKFGGGNKKRLTAAQRKAKRKAQSASRKMNRV